MSVGEYWIIRYKREMMMWTREKMRRRMLDKCEIDKDISWDDMKFNYGINLYNFFY